MPRRRRRISDPKRPLRRRGGVQGVDHLLLLGLQLVLLKVASPVDAPTVRPSALPLMQLELEVVSPNCPIASAAEALQEQRLHTISMPMAMLLTPDPRTPPDGSPQESHLAIRVEAKELEAALMPPCPHFNRHGVATKAQRVASLKCMRACTLGAIHMHMLHAVHA